MKYRYDCEPSTLDWKRGVENFGGDEELMTLMVNEFEKKLYSDYIKKLHKSVKDKNWEDVSSKSNSLKTTSGYIAATKLSDQCGNLNKATRTGNEESILKSYVNLLKEAKSLIKLFSRAQKKEAVHLEIDKLINEFLAIAHSVSQKNIESNSMAPKGSERDGNCCACNIF